MDIKDFFKLNQNERNNQYKKLDCSTLKNGDITKIYKLDNNIRIVEHILSYYPKLINDKSDQLLLEYLVTSNCFKTIDNYSLYVDLNLITSNGDTFLIYLISKELDKLIKNILPYNPNAINVPNKKGIYPVEYMCDKKMGKLLTDFATYIDLTLPASNERNLAGYMTIYPMEKQLANILTYNPEVINSRGKNKIQLVEYLADAEANEILCNFAQHIDLTLHASNNRNLAGYLVSKKLEKPLMNILTYCPSVIDSCGKDKIQLVEYLADSNFIHTLNNFSQHINLALPASNSRNLAGYLVSKNLKTSLFNILTYNPKIINTRGKNNIYLVEYLSDANFSSILNNFSQHIDLTLPASNNRNLAGYLISRNLKPALNSILRYNPTIINSYGKDKVPLVEYLKDAGFNSILNNFSQYINLKNYKLDSNLQKDENDKKLAQTDVKKMIVDNVEKNNFNDDIEIEEDTDHSIKSVVKQEETRELTSRQKLTLKIKSRL